MTLKNTLDVPNTQPIAELYAYISLDQDGNEGIVNATLPIVGTVRFVFGYRRVADKLRAIAHEVGRATNKRVRLVRFTNREIIDHNV